MQALYFITRRHLRNTHLADQVHVVATRRHNFETFFFKPFQDVEVSFGIAAVREFHEPYVPTISLEASLHVLSHLSRL
ncbi:hypothetical protein D3C86_1498940 [compost metagenome]